MTVELVHLAGRVWLFPADSDPDNVRGCVAVVAGDRGSVVVDAGNSPAMAREIQAAMVLSGLPAARWLVYTHHHWDHVWGACAWRDVEVVAHAASLPLLTAEAAKPWSHRYLREQVAANPLLGPSMRARAWAMDSWDDFAIVPPHRTFGESLTLPANIRLQHVGGQHAPDSTVVSVDDSGVVLLGDCFYPPPHHLRGPDDVLNRAMLRRLQDDRYDWYVDSHSPPHHRSGLAL